MGNYAKCSKCNTTHSTKLCKSCPVCEPARLTTEKEIDVFMETHAMPALKQYGAALREGSGPADWDVATVSVKAQLQRVIHHASRGMLEGVLIDFMVTTAVETQMPTQLAGVLDLMAAAAQTVKRDDAPSSDRN